MTDKYYQGDDLLSFLRSNHTGSENPAPSVRLERVFGINGVAVRQIVNKLRCEGQPVCSNASGYFYAKSCEEIDNTVEQLLSRSRSINSAAQGLVLSRQIFYDGEERSM